MGTGMQDAKLPQHISYLPFLILGIYIVLYIFKLFLRHATQISGPKRLQQKDQDLQLQTPLSQDLCSRSQGQEGIFRTDRENREPNVHTGTRQAIDERGEAAETRPNIAAPHLSGSRQDLLIHSDNTRQRLSPQPTPEKSAPGHSPTAETRRFEDRDSNTGSIHTKSENRSDTENRPLRNDKSIGRDVEISGRVSNNDHILRSRKVDAATQIYINTKSQQTDAPFIVDKDAIEQVITDLVETVIQTTQQHMFTQLQQSMQQTFSGLTLGTPVRAKDQVDNFTANTEAVILTKTQRINSSEDSDYSDWNSDGWHLNNVDPLTGIPTNSDKCDDTVPKRIESAANCDIVKRTSNPNRPPGFPTGKPTNSNKISGVPAGFEEDEETGYGRSVPVHLYATRAPFPQTNPRIRTYRPQNRHIVRPYGPQGNFPAPIPRPRPWENQPYGRKTRSQAALRARAQKKVARRYPLYQDQ